MVRINGLDTDNAAGLTIQTYLETTGLGKSHVAVERNGSIVPRSTFSEVTLADGDTIEIVHFVGGG